MVRRGFSRIELILTLAILGLLVSLAVPAIEAARESSRKSQCAFRLRQLGLALHTYHDSFKVFPPAATWGSEGLELATLSSHRDPTPVHVTRQNWIQLLLPYLDSAELSHQFNSDYPVAHPSNKRARLTRVQSFLCPSDPHNISSNPYVMNLPDGTIAEFARGNFALNGGSEWVQAGFGTLSYPAPTETRFKYSDKTREFQWWNNGIGGINTCFSSSGIHNGESTLIAIEEVRAGVFPLDPRGVWSLGQIGGSITWGHGMMGDAREPNSLEINADDILNGPKITQVIGRKKLQELKMPCCDHCDENAQATARSMHRDGVNVCFLDGSMRFASNRIDHGLWHVMHSREVPSHIFDQNHFDTDLKGTSWQEMSPTARAIVSAEPLKEFSNSIEMKFAFIPTGSFTMGTPNKDNIDLFPENVVPHPVTISRPFFLSIHEVTQDQFKRVMHTSPSWHKSDSTKNSHLGPKANSENWPVENISWQEAADFCEALSDIHEEKVARRYYRLPSEAEWEYACRAGCSDPLPLTGSQRQATQDATTVSPSLLPPGFEIRPVCLTPPNAFGIYNMTDNVYEWVNDYYERGYYQDSKRVDPRGPSRGYVRVVRGWHWVAVGPYCKEFVAIDPGSRNRYVGFRVACEIYSQ